MAMNCAASDLISETLWEGSVNYCHQSPKRMVFILHQCLNGHGWQGLYRLAGIPWTRLWFPFWWYWRDYRNSHSIQQLFISGCEGKAFYMNVTCAFVYMYMGLGNIIIKPYFMVILVYMYIWLSWLSCKFTLKETKTHISSLLLL